MEKEPKEGLKKHRNLVNKYAEKTGLTIDIDLDGDFELKKKYSEDNIAVVVLLRLVEKGYITINIYDKQLIDSVNTDIAQPIIKSGDDVILINRDIQGQLNNVLLRFQD